VLACLLLASCHYAVVKVRRTASAWPQRQKNRLLVGSRHFVTLLLLLPRCSASLRVYCLLPSLFYERGVSVTAHSQASLSFYQPFPPLARASFKPILYPP